MVNGLTTAGRGRPDYKLALRQHTAYVEALKRCGLAVTVLEPDEGHPDSTFVEDTALLIPGAAVITPSGAPSRLGEAATMEPVLARFFGTIERIVHPGTVDSGDVLMAASHCFIGLSRRTNRAGADQLITILQRYGLTGSTVPLQKALHLKSGVACLENDTMVVSGEFVGREEFGRHNQVTADDDESAGANCVWINDTVIMAAGYPKLAGRLAGLRYRLVQLDLSEFEKLDGGASCLSLRF
jgi:dimethylargininase